MKRIARYFTCSRLVAPALAIAALTLLAEAWTVWPTWRALVVVMVGVWMAAPGVVLMRAVLARSHVSGVAAWLIGPALGLGVSVFGIFPWWAAGIQNWAAIILGPGLTWACAALVRHLGPPVLRLPVFSHRDLLAASLVVLLVPAITWAPYDHVREPVADGEAYRAYFTADFIWAMTVTAELAKGDVPPVNPFLRERPLNYYWFSHFLSGATFRNLANARVSTEPVVLINGLMFGSAFVLFMYALVRIAGASPAFSAFAVFCGFCANSYEGADMIRAALAGRIEWPELLNTNVDAVTRWFYKGMPVDGLQRLLLYQPHHLTGYVLALAALWLVSIAEDVTGAGVALAAGLLLALALLFSTFGAVMVSFAVALLYIHRLVQQRALASIWQCAILAGAPVLLGVLATSALGFTDTRYGFLLQVGVNPVAVRDFAQVWVLSFGPLLFGALAACTAWQWLARDGAVLVVLVIAATLFYFFTNVPDVGGVWVGWRAGHMLLIAFSAMSGAWLTRRWSARRWRPVVAAGVLVLVVAALPTVVIDVYNAQDITNRREGAGFPWTLIVTPAEREALEWVRQTTPATAVVQTDPEARGAAHWSYIGAFAERRMAAGLPIAMTPLRPYQLASDDVKWGIFTTTAAADCHASARFLGIDYLFIGEPERHRYASSVAAMLDAPHLFPIAFQNAAVTILRVAPIGPGAPSRRLLDPADR